MHRGLKEYIHKEAVLQNHRRTSADHLVQPSCSKEGQLEQVRHGCIQLGFEHLQGWGCHKIYGKSAPVFDHPHSEKVLSYV